MKVLGIFLAVAVLTTSMGGSEKHTCAALTRAAAHLSRRPGCTAAPAASSLENHYEDVLARAAVGAGVPQPYRGRPIRP